MSVSTDLVDVSLLEIETGHDVGAPETLVAYRTDRGRQTYSVTEPEQVPKLFWPLSVPVYTRMATEPKVTEVLRSIIHPIRAAKRALDPTGCRPEVVQRVASNLGVRILGSDFDPARVARRTRDRFSLSEHIRLALEGSLTYGHAVFEQQARVVEEDGRQYADLRKLAPRFQDTIAKIEVARDGGLVGIRQWPAPGLLGNPLGEEPLIGVERLVVYSFERRGAAWQGRSLLRPLYAPWYQKDDALRGWLTMLRRTGMGIATYIGPPGATQTQLDAGAAKAQSARAGENGGVGIPNGASIAFEGVRGTLPDHEKFVRYCDESMAGAALAEFLKLGSSTTGSRAVGDTFVDFFALSLAAVDDWLMDTLNAHVIEDLVDWNYGEGEPAPRLITTERIGTDQQAVASSIQGLISCGALTPDASLEAWVRRAYSLPERDTENAPTGQSYAYDLDYGILTVNERRAQIGLEPIAGGDKLPEPSIDRRPAEQVAASRLGPTRPRQVAAAGGTTRLRDLTQVEAAASYDPTALDLPWQAQLEALLTAWALIRADQIDALMERLEGLLEDDDLAALATSAPLGLGTADLTTAMTAMAEAAAAAAVAEAAAQGLTLSPAEIETLADGIAARAVATDALLASGLANAAIREAMVQAGASVSRAAVVAAVREHLESLSDVYLREQLGGALTAAQNSARVATWTPLGEGVTFVASELLDGATCDECAAIDGQVFDTLAEAEVQYPTGGHKDCRGGARCRGTLVMIRNEAAPST